MIVLRVVGKRCAGVTTMEAGEDVLKNAGPAGRGRLAKTGKS
jgi:hypothetical protein